MASMQVSLHFVISFLLSTTSKCIYNIGNLLKLTTCQFSQYLSQNHYPQNPEIMSASFSMFCFSNFFWIFAYYTSGDVKISLVSHDNIFLNVALFCFAG